MRSAGKRIAEISAFAVRKDFQGNAGKILFPLTKFMWEYASNTLRLDFLVGAVHPKMADFYEAILLMRRLSGETVEAYGFANDKPAVGLMLDLSTVLREAFRVYAGKRSSKDLYRYYTRHELRNFSRNAEKLVNAQHPHDTCFDGDGHDV